MNKGDWNRAYMYAKILHRIAEGRPPYTDDDVQRAEAIRRWYKTTGREYIVIEGEKIFREKWGKEGK